MQRSIQSCKTSHTTHPIAAGYHYHNEPSKVNKEQGYKGFSIVGIGIALLQHAYSPTQIGLCLFESSPTEIPQPEGIVI